MKSITELQETKGTFSVGQAIGDGWNLVSKHAQAFQAMISWSMEQQVTRNMEDRHNIYQNS